MSKVKNILDKLRPDSNGNKQAKTVERIAAIGHTTDAIGWRPVPYTTPDRFTKFLSDLDSDIGSFIAKAGPDKYNPEYYKIIVDGEVALAIKELKPQRTEHERSIHNIRIYQQACLKDLENHLQRMEEALAKNKEVQ